MPNQSIETLVDGGKATAAPPLGPALGPLGVNIGLVVAEINKKTEAFKGMQVPVKIIVKSETKEFTITVGTPPASQLILKEAKVEKASANPAMDQVADLRIEQIIKISKMKEDALLGKSLKEKIKEIIGTCQAMGILVEGVKAHDAIVMVNEGKFDKEIKAEKTELSAEEMRELDEEKRKLAKEIETRKAEFTSKAKSILESMKGKPTAEIRSKMAEAGIPSQIAEELISAEKAAAAAAGTAAAGAATPSGGAAKPGAGAAPAAGAAAGAAGGAKPAAGGKK
jgi:large subunit ribosomal protein L11